MCEFSISTFLVKQQILDNSDSGIVVNEEHLIECDLGSLDRHVNVLKMRPV
jgi:hypothetical protein